MKKILVTGAEGFAGRHLLQLLLKKSARLSAACFHPRHRSEIPGGARIFPCDIRKSGSVQELLRKCKPKGIFHLAALSNVPKGEMDPEGTMRTNFWGTWNLLKAAAKHAPKCRILLISSGDIFGDPQRESLPLKEDAPPKPSSFYALSKACQDLVGQFFHKKTPLRIITVRPFNFIGPGQSSDFVCSSFARQIAEMELGLREPVLQVGNLETRRDFTDVRDMVRAFWLAFLRGIPGEVYHACSGESTAIRTVLDILLSFSRTRFSIRQEPSRVRRGEVREIVGSPEKLFRRTGWKKRIRLERSLKDILQHWRKVLSSGELEG